MPGLDLKRFDKPDETVTFELGHTDLVTIGPLTVGREVEEPGWRWSTHVRPIAGTERCEFHHVGMQVSGRLMVETRDGEVGEIGPGDLYDTAPSIAAVATSKGSAARARSTKRRRGQARRGPSTSRAGRQTAQARRRGYRR